MVSPESIRAEIKNCQTQPLTQENCERLLTLFSLEKCFSPEYHPDRWFESMDAPPKWSWVSVDGLRQSLGWSCDTNELWIGMNATWAALGPVFEKFSMVEDRFIAEVAKAFWLEDANAVENKEKAYYEHVLKKS